MTCCRAELAEEARALGDRLVHLVRVRVRVGVRVGVRGRGRSC